jgi:hypothetical protein
MQRENRRINNDSIPEGRLLLNSAEELYFLLKTAYFQKEESEMEIKQRAETIRDILERQKGQFVTVFFGSDPLSGILAATVGEHIIQLSDVKMHGQPYGEAAVIRIDSICALAVP